MAKVSETSVSAHELRARSAALTTLERVLRGGETRPEVVQACEAILQFTRVPCQGVPS